MSAELRRSLTRRELAATAHRAAARKRLAPALDESEMLVVAHLAEQGGLPPSELGRRLGLSSGGITAVIHRLEVDGYLVRRPHPHDARSVIVSLTPTAIEQGTCLYEPLRAALDQLAAEFSPECHDAIVEFLERAAEITAQHAARIRGRAREDAAPRLTPGLWA